MFMFMVSVSAVTFYRKSNSIMNQEQLGVIDNSDSDSNEI